MSDLNARHDARLRAIENCPVRRDLKSCRNLLQVALNKFDSTWKKGIRPDKFRVSGSVLIVSDGYQAAHVAIPDRLVRTMAALAKSDLNLNAIVNTDPTNSRYDEFVFKFKKDTRS